MKESFIYYYIWATLAGVVTGVTAYHISNPQPEEYKPNMTRSTTITGKGQFKCQTGC